MRQKLGTTERKEREKEKRREDILKAAVQVFFKKGVDNATMDEIAAAAELSKATLYLYFTSKEEIYFFIHLEGHKKLFKMMESAVEKTTETREKIAIYIRTLIEFQKKHPDYFEAFFYFLTHEKNIDRNNPYIKKHQKLEERFLNSWIAIVQQGKNDSLIRENLDEISTAVIIWMQLIGFLKIYSVLHKDLKKVLNITKEGILSEYFELIFSGMMKK
jgi:AcrR family transcriptional regulator